MEALYVQSLQEDGVMTKEEEGEQSEEQEASYPLGSTTDEETDEDSEPEPPAVIRRKVSFADAFGLNLVSVKEFDNTEVTEPEVNQPPEMEATCPLEEFYMSCLFTVPCTPEELDQRLQAQMLELESIELLPGTTTLRGIVRVVNLCYSKSVYARITLDRWASFFDLLAEYVPGSSDRKTDRFAFKYTLVPPFEREGTRVEICLRYETSLGTFWANNKEMNYVLFCHQKVKEPGPQVQEEGAGYKSKRSCLKANRRGSAEEKIRETSNTSTVAAEEEATDKAEETDRETMDSADIQSLLYSEEHKQLVDSIKSRHRATRLARVQDFLSQRRQQIPKAYSHDSASGQKVSQPAPWGDSASFLHKRQMRQSDERPQVLTYHQIPLLTLDWNCDKARQWGTSHTDDIWTGRAKVTESKTSEQNIADTPSVNDMWEAFLNSTDDTSDKETSVCDVWQAFLNGPSCTDHSAVPESEWLQTAASVSPSNDKEPKTQYAASSQENAFQVGADTPTTLQARTSAACQLLSDAHETAMANVTLNAEDHQSAEACVSGLRDDNTATQKASQRSQTNSVTDTLQEFSPEGATPVSEGSVDSSAECHKHAIGEREKGGIIGGAGGIGGDEPFTPRTADFVTSSGETETTDMTAMPESQNASAVDRISQGARLDEGLSSSSREGEVTGSAHNAMDDTLAFRGTIRQGTKNGERFVFSTSRRGAEEGIANYCTANKVYTEEEIFRPPKTEECEISQRYAAEKLREEFRLNQNSENPLQENEGDENEIRPAQSLADGFSPNQMCQERFEKSKIMASEFKLDEFDNEDVASGNKNVEVEKIEVDPSYCATSEETKRQTAEEETIQSINQDEALKLSSSWQRGNTSISSEVHNKHSRQIHAVGDLCSQKEESTLSTLTQIQENEVKSETGEHITVPNQTEEGKSLSCDGSTVMQQEINPLVQRRHTMESREMKKVFQSNHDTFRPFHADKYNPNPVEVAEMRWTHSPGDTKGPKEDASHGIRSGEVRAKENIIKEDTSIELQRQPETLERIEEDMSQRDKDERVSTGKLKIEGLGELMGNVENPRGERKNAPAELKEQELSAEAESSPRVECKKLSEGTKDPITAENTGALEAIESGLEERFIERFGEDLVRGIWEEVFGGKVQASSRDTNIGDGLGSKLAEIPALTGDCHPLFEKDFDSGIFSLTELPADPNSSPCQGQEQTLEPRSNEHYPKERSPPLATAEQTHSLSELQTDSNLSGHLSRDLGIAQSEQSFSEPTQSPPKHQENCAHIKDRSVTHQETGRQIEECVVARRESFNASAHPSHPRPSSCAEKLKESNSLVLWSMLYILSHLTRLLICALLVAGFFFVVFLYDFPAFFALYVSSLCWGFYKCKRYRATANKGMVG